MLIYFRIIIFIRLHKNNKYWDIITTYTKLISLLDSLQNFQKSVKNVACKYQKTIWLSNASSSDCLQCVATSQ